MSARGMDVNMPMDSGEPRSHEELLALDHIRFFSALYMPEDILLFRPLETWTENGKKRARTIYKHTVYRAADPAVMHFNQGLMLRIAEREKANTFFGVCPRLGDNGRFDLAWQIRKVPALWADIDHCSVEEAFARCAAGGIPTPTIIVNSGNGVHLYWCLDTPYLITDAGDPPPVQGVWTEKNGKRKLRRYIVDEHGDEIELDKRHLLPKISAQAQLVQDVLSGIAAKIGGDHTQDLSRLLRVPGTLNRKNERNGQEPIACTLVKCDPDQRYSFEEFADLAAASPEVAKRAAIAQMPLPAPRKLTTARAEHLDDWIAKCRVARKGNRSTTDFGLCCFAIRNRIAKEEVWSRVQELGKFAEGGERYFERTWERAEEVVRFDKYQSIEADQNAPPSELGEVDDNEPAEAHTREGVIEIDSSTTPVWRTMGLVTDALLDSGTAFSRADQCVVLRGQDLVPLTTPQALAGHLNQFVEFYYCEPKSGGYRPLSHTLANTWLHNAAQLERLPAIRLFSRNPVYTSDWKLCAPGYDPESQIYYAGEAVPVLEGTQHIDTLLRGFCFKGTCDRTNYLAMMLTVPLVYHFIGSKPATLFNGNQPGVGKTILAQILAVLRDGNEAATATYNADDTEFEKRLASIVRRGATTIIIDNAKSKNRSERIESATLERLITDQVLSFRLLGSSADIRAENSHFFCITANSSDVSRDLITRCVVVNLRYEGDPSKRTFTLTDPQSYAYEHRTEILGELLGMIERWKEAGRPEADISTRFNRRGWGRIVGGILAANGYTGFMANAEEAAAEFDQTHRDFAELVKLMAQTPGQQFRGNDLTTLAVSHRLLGNELGSGSERSQATRMGILVSRFVARRFELDDQRLAVFHRTTDRKGPQFHIEIEASSTAGSVEPVVPDVGATLPDVDLQTSGGSKSLETSTLPDVPDVARPLSATHYTRETEEHVQENNVLRNRADGEGLQRPQRLAGTACDHLNPDVWVHRDGSAFCPACDRFMGRLCP